MIDITDFENFITDFIKQKQQENHIPGVAFVMVKNGSILLSKAFGYSNFEKQKSVMMDETLFRVASVSKTFTIAALLQLAEQNKIDLEAETNQYLEDFKVKNRFSKPQQIKHLLLHIDGFEERVVKANALRYESIPSLKELFKKQLKPLFTEPGNLITYGNTGVALASYLVEKISGVPFTQYVEENIFKPLEMANSIMRQNFSVEEKERLATIYSYVNGNYIPYDIAYTVTPGTGGASIIPNEMANFLIALLQGGKYKNSFILQPNTVSTMLARQFSSHPEMPGVTYGFFEHYVNGVRALLRDGSGFSINSRILLWPEHNMGFFVVTNCSAAQLCIELTQKCFDYFFPPQKNYHNKVISSAEAVMRSYKGQYQAIQYSRYSMSKILKLWMGPLAIETKDESTITIEPLSYEPFSELTGRSHWQQIKPGIFEGNERKGRMYFKKNKRMNLFSGIFYHSTYEKSKWYEKPKLHKNMFKIFSIMFAILSIASIIGIFNNNGMVKILFSLSAVASIIGAAFSFFIIPMLLKKGFIKGYPSFLFIDAPLRLGLSALFALPFINIAIIIALGSMVWYGINILDLWNLSFFGMILFTSILFILFIKYWNLLRIKVS